MHRSSNSARLLSVAIARSADEVYAFLSVPENFTRWASGLAARLRRGEGNWIVDITEPNRYGVLDHSIRLPSGASIYVPLRVVAKGEGCELVLKLFRQPGVSEEQFAADAEWMMRELQASKRILEGQEREESDEPSARV